MSVLSLQTNMQALNSQKSLAVSTRANEESMQKLSSGYRINKSADDAAGLAISEKLKADIRGLNMAKRNANDGISMLQVAEGGMNEISNILGRLRELSVQGASDTIGDQERSFIDKEFRQLKDEVDRIANSTEYNGTLLIVGDGTRGDMEDAFNSTRAWQKPRSDERGSLEIQVGKNWYEGIDGREAAGDFARNPVNIIRASFDKYDSSALGLGLREEGEGAEDAPTTGTWTMDGTPEESKMLAQRSISKIDNAISKLAEYRSDLGATQNRLTSTIGNLSVMTENYSAANSRIRDTDYASETAKNAQATILKQAGIAMLTQANQSAASVVRLLG